MDINKIIKRIKMCIQYGNKIDPVDVQNLINAYEEQSKELEKEKEKNTILLQCLKDSQERCENEHLFLGNPNMYM